jgi:hypothetical protein
MAAPVYAPITVAEVEAAQRAWGDALVAIATEHDRNGQAAAKRLAERVVDSAYATIWARSCSSRPWLPLRPPSAPTARAPSPISSAAIPVIRATTGFALKGWRSYEIKNAGILITGSSATSMGNVTVIDSKGARTTVDKTWGYVRGPDGKLRIVLHHSSLPYKAN